MVERTRDRMRSLTKEELRHPDVRMVMPNLCGLGFSVDYEKIVYPIADILRLFREAYGDVPFFPIRTVDMPGSDRLEDRVDFIDDATDDDIRRYGSGRRIWRPGQETTIRNLVSITDSDDRILAFLYAVVHGAERGAEECGAIYEAVYRRFAISVIQNVRENKNIWEYTHNTKYTELWSTSIGTRWDDKTFEDCRAVRSVKDLVRVLAKVAGLAQKEGALIRIHSVPDDLRIERCRRAAREALDEALASFESNDFRNAESHVRTAAHLLGQYNGQVLVRDSKP